MTAALQFVGGDEVVEPFLLEGTDGEIIDLTTVTFSAGVWWRERLRIPLTIGAGIEITNEYPARAVAAEDQEPHGKLKLTETQTALIPRGQIAAFRIVAVRSIDQITMSSFFVALERIA